MKRRITNISAVGIIYPEYDPSQIFIEMKDDGHPIKLVRRQLCPIGGNWIGSQAAHDQNTFATFERKLREELSLTRFTRDSGELAQMDLAEAQKFAPTPVNKVEATNFDLPGLENLKDTMVRNAYAFGDYLNTVPKSALDAADPSNKRDGFTTLTSYWTIYLRANDWENLCAFPTQPVIAQPASR